MSGTRANITLSDLYDAMKAYEEVARHILICLEVHNTKLDAILEAAQPPPGPSPTMLALEQVVLALKDQTAAVHALPSALIKAMREDALAELGDEAMEPDGAGAWNT